MLRTFLKFGEGDPPEVREGYQVREGDPLEVREGNKVRGGDQVGEGDPS